VHYDIESKVSYDICITLIAFISAERGLEHYVTNLYIIETENFTLEIPRVKHVCWCCCLALQLLGAQEQLDIKDFWGT
jgi:hypothetical protein